MSKARRKIRRRPGGALLIALSIVLFAVEPALSEPTEVTVRVVSRGAKFIGGAVASAEITFRDAATGALLVQGTTEGGTGDTERIMEAGEGRDRVLSDESAAAFETTVDLDRPRLVTITARGPLNQPQSAVEVSTQQWLLPGVDLTAGDGILLELPGLIVDLLGPPAHTRHGAGEVVELRAQVSMMCGCGLTPGGLWDSEGTVVEARIYRDGERLETVPLHYAGETSAFEGSFTPGAPGIHEIELVAYQPATNNTGLDRGAIFVSAAR